MVAAILPDISDTIAPGVKIANKRDDFFLQSEKRNLAIPWPIRSTRRNKINKIFMIKLFRGFKYETNMQKL
jgi:hypothetical protein